MAAIEFDNLTALPEPRAVLVDYDLILADKKARFAAAARKFGIDPAPLLALESEPTTILLEEDAYSNVLLLDYINVRYRSRLLYFAIGPDLDHVAEEYGVTRLPEEPDEDLRTRVRIKNRGSSSAGPDDWWRYHAMTADERVEAVAVQRPSYPLPAPGERRGTVTLSILAETADGIPSSVILANVRERVNSTSVRGTTTQVIVKAATAQPFTVEADVWLLPDSQAHVFDGLEAAFRDAYASWRALGRDVTSSWVTGQLMRPGVAKVALTAPPNDIVVDDHEAGRLDGVTLRLAGRMY